MTPSRARARSSDTPNYICSFCGKAASEVASLISGPGVFICDECVALCNTALDKGALPPNSIPDWQQMPTDELSGRMVRVAQARDQVDDFVGFAVRQLRSRGVTWAEIGAALGVTRQAAWDRYSGEE